MSPSFLQTQTCRASGYTTRSNVRQSTRVRTEGGRGCEGVVARRWFCFQEVQEAGGVHADKPPSGCLVSATTATRNADTRPGARQRLVLAVATSASFNFDAWLAAWDPRNGGVYVYVVRLVGLCGGSRYWEVGLIARSCPLNVRGLARC
jgi:hypothetical protein